MHKLAARLGLLLCFIASQLFATSTPSAHAAMGTNSSAVTNLTSGLSGVSGSAFKDIATDDTGAIIVAVADLGDILLSVDTGTTWSNKTTGTSLSGLAWRSVALSGDGQVLYAAVYGGDIYKSTDSGNSWTATTLTTGHNKNWTGVTTSRDGSRVFAVARSDYLYYSINGGTSWTRPSPYPTGYSSTTWPFTGVATDAAGSLTVTSNNFGSIFASFTSSMNSGLLESSAGYFNDVAQADNGARSYAVATFSGSDQYSFHTFVQYPEFNKYAQVVGTACYQQTCAGGLAVGTNEDGRLTIHGRSSSQLFISTNSGYSFSTLTNSPTANWQSIAVNNPGDIAFAAVANGDIYKISPDIASLSYSLIYNADGGVGCTQQALPTSGFVTLTSSSSCTKSSNTLKYWRINGVNYSPGASIQLIEQLNAIAIWAPRVTLTYSSNFATSGSAPTAVTVDSGTTISLATNSGNLKKTNLAFNGWNTLANGQGVRYASGDSFTVNNTLTLYAMWSTNVPSSVSLSQIATEVIFRGVVSVQVTVEQPGKVTFFNNGKRISGCISKPVVTSYTCSWRPDRHGANIVTATLLPTESGYARVTSSPRNLGAAKRTGSR